MLRCHVSMIPSALLLLYPVLTAGLVCTEPGLFCTSACTKLVRCIGKGNNTYISQQIRTCPSQIGQLCNPSSLDCSASSCDDADYQQQPFYCFEAGTFPHPYSCSKYLICLENTIGVAKDCPSGTAYNGAFQNCTSDMLTARGCEDGPIPKCTNQEDIAAYPDNREIYYVCSYNNAGYLLPQLRRCNKGNIFDDDEGGCVPGSASSINISYLLLSVITAIILAKC